MPRRKGLRRVCFCPGANYFKPRGVPALHLEEVELGEDEWEALRLADFEGLEQTKAAKEMKVSQSTFQRILKEARGKTASALVLSKAIKVRGGEENMVKPRKGMGLGRRAPVSGGRGRQGGPLAAGPGGVCSCTKCKCEVPHKTGVACYEAKCPECGGGMIRKKE